MCPLGVLDREEGAGDGRRRKIRREGTKKPEDPSPARSAQQTHKLPHGSRNAGSDGKDSLHVERRKQRGFPEASVKAAPTSQQEHWSWAAGANCTPSGPGNSSANTLQPAELS